MGLVVLGIAAIVLGAVWLLLPDISSAIGSKALEAERARNIVGPTSDRVRRSASWALMVIGVILVFVGFAT